MLLTTYIELESNNCVFLVNYLVYIQFASQLFSTVLFSTRLGRLARPTFTSANCRQIKYEVKNPKLGSLSLKGQLHISLPCLVNVANRTDQNRKTGLYIPRKLSRYSVYNSTVFNSVVPNKFRQTSAPNSHNFKPSPEKIKNQQPKR